MWMSQVVVVALVCAVLSAPEATLGQATQPTQPQPMQTPQPTTRPGEQSAEEMLRQMLQPQGDAAQPLRPAPEATAEEQEGEVPPAPSATAQPLIPDGTPLLDRVGRLTPGPDGTMEFTLESDGRILADPPMLLLPNRKLQELENGVRASYRDLKVSVSGEVTTYRGRNYLLLSRWSVVQDVVQPLR